MTITENTHPNPSTPQPPSTGVTDPHQLHTAFMAATNDHDVEAMLALYEPGGTAVGLDGAEVRGPEALRAMVVGLTTAIRRIEGGTRKVVVAGDLALSSGTWTADVVLVDGTVVQQSGVTAEVSRRQADGTWKFVVDDPLF